MYKLIGSPKTRAFRVLWMLEELGLPYEIDPAYPQSAELKEIYPAGKVPVLMDGDAVIPDSVAIIQYLADKHGQATAVAGTIERAQQDGVTQFLCDEIDGALWTAARNTFILPEERRVPEIKETLKWEFSRSIAKLSDRLAANEFLMGDRLTVPDIILTHCGGWARTAKFDIPDGPVSDYFRRMIKHPSYLIADEIRSKA